ncbi:MAG TPA: tRNA-dihydrouridine synthase [Patescibacteria group bacterium]|nr:tRNA-dihydrouridine synthase [Patescibacteria group bacterium]
MKENFWAKLEKPIFALAPMANVTDNAFRSIIARFGKPDVMWTEFVSVDGLLSPGREKLLVDFEFEENQRPIVAQIFGSRPEHFEKVADLIANLGFDGIDINMGCPVKKVINQSSCSDLIRHPTLALEIVDATKRGARGLPVSVKTRLGFGKVEIETWIPKILESQPAALTVHLRTVKEMSKVPAHWELMRRITEIRNQMAKANQPVLLGNGDVMNLAEARQKVSETGCDGVMLGRAIFGNPWLFGQADGIPTIESRLSAMLEHAGLFEKQFSNLKNFEVMKKHFKAYIMGFDGAKELRTKLMEAKNYQDVARTVAENYPDIKLI